MFPLAPNGVWWSLQGEGHLRGFQMAFVRLAGCSVGCPQCDTDYSLAEKVSGDELIARLRSVSPVDDRDAWVWVTGGEPADHDLRSLVSLLKSKGYSVCVASSGAKRVIPPVDWLSISPHSPDPAKFLQRYGNEVKLVEGLNGLNLDEWYAVWPDSRTDFLYRYVQPMTKEGREDPASLARCLAFLKKHPRWALSRQDHVVWGVA